MNEEIINETESAAGAVETSQNESDAQIADLQNQIATLSDKYLRTLAELENTRRRSAIDSAGAARARAISVAESFLPLIDAIGAAAGHTPDDEGIKTLAAAAENVLTKIGITKIESLGMPLNPQFHNAIQTEPKTESVSENTITQELQAGYTFGDNVIRPAMVIVAK